MVLSLFVPRRGLLSPAGMRGHHFAGCVAKAPAALADGSGRRVLLGRDEPLELVSGPGHAGDHALSAGGAGRPRAGSLALPCQAGTLGRRRPRRGPARTVVLYRHFREYRPGGLWIEPAKRLAVLSMVPQFHQPDRNHSGHRDRFAAAVAAAIPHDPR